MVMDGNETWLVVAKVDSLPFPMSVLVFLSAFGVLAVSFWPYMIPYSVRIADAAAPPASLSFMFWGAGLFVIPITLIYTIVSYHVFQGPMRDSDSE